MNAKNIFLSLLLLVVNFSLLIFDVKAQALANTSKKSAVVYKVVNGVTIPVPPPGHPRLYVNADQVATISDRLTNSTMATLTSALQARSSLADGKAEWDAIQYLVTNNSTAGRATIVSTLALMKKTSGTARVNGRMMVTGAVVYDWHYSLLTETEKTEYITEFVRLAKSLECGYPPTVQGNVTGHSSETFIMRDMLSAGIAIYGEFPEMYELAAARFFGKLVPVRNWLYNGHAYHQGDSYGPGRFNHEIVPNFIFKCMGVDSIYNAQQRYVPYYFLYSTRPDGSLLRSGDTFKHTVFNPGEMWDTYSVNVLMASYYNDGILMDQFLTQGPLSVKNNEYLFAFLWWDTSVQRIPVNTLPLTRYFGNPFGWMIARTGWGANAVVAEMKVNQYNFVNHQHIDAGSFQVYYRGSLATVSGLYGGTDGDYGSTHCKNYYWRTIAHNCMLVNNPSEVFREGYTNDGGQRLPGNRVEANDLNDLLNNGYKTGEVLARGFGPDLQEPDYTYLKGDIKEAYSNKVTQAKRSFVFLNLRKNDVPAALIVFDKVVSSNASFKKTWLLHCIAEPAVSGSEVTVTRVTTMDNGKMVNTVLLPETENADIVPVGGPGKEFLVNGINYTNESQGDPSYERAAWRIELSPKTAAQEDYFFNVMQVMENGINKLSVKKMDGDKVVGAMISDRIVFFSKNSETVSSDITFSFTDEGTFKILLTDIQSGAWKVSRDGNEIIPDAIVKQKDGIMYFEGTKGNYSLTRFPTSVQNKKSKPTNIIYPNPFSTTFNVSFNFKVEEVRISDIAGRTLFTLNKRLNPGEVEKISPSNLTAGIYLLSAHNQSIFKSSLLIKQ